MEAFFPNITMEHLIKFYGTASSKKQKEFWNKLVISNVRHPFLVALGYGSHAITSEARSA